VTDGHAFCVLCGAAIVPGGRFCQECGASVDVRSAPPATVAAADEPHLDDTRTDSTPTCQGCGRPLRTGSRFCLDCGVPVDTSEPRAPSQPSKPEPGAPTEPSKPELASPVVTRVPAVSTKNARAAPGPQDWIATHRVPSTGIRLWAEPDPESKPNGKLAAGVELEVVRVWGAWAEIRLANGWIAWVDNRQLERPPA